MRDEVAVKRQRFDGLDLKKNFQTLRDLTMVN